MSQDLDFPNTLLLPRVEASFYSDMVECLPVDPAIWVRFPAGTGKIFLLYDMYIFFQNLLFKKNISGTLSECQTVWIQIRPNRMSGLILIQTVGINYHKRTKFLLAGRVFNNFSSWRSTVKPVLSSHSKEDQNWFLRPIIA